MATKMKAVVPKVGKDSNIVSGESARHALDLAFEITRQVQQSK